MFKMLEARKEDLSMIIETEKYGNVTVYKDEKTRFGNIYFVVANKGKKQLAGVIDKKGQEVIPIEEMTLEECFYTKNKEDICFGFRILGLDTLKYYHVQKREDDIYKLKIATNPYDLETISIRQVKENQDVWVFEKKTKNEELEYAIYDPKEARMLTCFFDELNFDIGANPYGHFAYVCNYISAEIESDNGVVEEVPLTTVAALIGRNGSFSSQILDTEDDKLYNSYFVNGTSTSKEYSILLASLHQKHLNEYLEKEERINNTLTYLFNNYNQSVEPSTKQNQKPAKILEFKPKTGN